MTQEEKQELLIALCGYFPHGVKCQVTHIDKYGEIQTRDMEQNCANVCMDQIVHLGEWSWLDCKHYLRPMSSMTQLERFKYLQLCETDDGDFTGEHLYFNTCESFDYLNSIHVDYRNFIQRGLALEASEGMYI